MNTLIKTKWPGLATNLLIYSRLDKLLRTALRSLLLALVGDSPPSLPVSTGRVRNHWNLHVPRFMASEAMKSTVPSMSAQSNDTELPMAQRHTRALTLAEPFYH